MTDDAERYSSDSSIHEDDSLSFVENRPEEIENEYDDAFEPADADEPPTAVERSTRVDHDESAATAASLDDPFRELLAHEPTMPSPLKSAHAMAGGAAAIVFPRALGILDPTSHEDEFVSRTEPHPTIARLLNRLKKKEKANATSEQRDQAALTVASPPPALLAATSAAGLPTAAVSSIVSRLRSAPPRPLSHPAVQPEHFPLPTYSSLYRPSTTKVQDMQTIWNERASRPLETDTNDKENRCPASAISAHPPPSADAFPSDAVPLARLTAQLRVNAALTRLATHDFFHAHRHTMPHPQIERDHPAVAAMARQDRYACRNPAHVHRSDEFESLLNQLYIQRANPTCLEDEALQRHAYHESIVLANSIRTGLDLYRSANAGR
jgi:hypothetical protein